MKVDLQGRRARPVRQRPAALHRLQGAQRALREAAVRRGLHVSEYGILDDETGETTALRDRGGGLRDGSGSTWIPPELREGRGELEAALAKGRAAAADRARRPARRPALPHDALRRPPDARGDGRGGARRAAASTSRSPTTRPRTGSATTSRPRRWRRGSRRSRALNARLDGFELLAGTESNILPDGSLDYPDELLARLDWVIASIHTSFGMDEEAMTDRMIAAIEHPLVDAIGHPTGPQDRDAPAVRARHGARDRGGRAHRHDDRDQRRARPARHERAPRPRGGRGRRADPDRLRRALGAQPRRCCATAIATAPPRAG